MTVLAMGALSSVSRGRSFAGAVMLCFCDLGDAGSLMPVRSVVRHVAQWSVVARSSTSERRKLQRRHFERADNEWEIISSDLQVPVLRRGY